MNTHKLNNKKTEVYSISGFRDTLASPVFYPVVVVALVLGVTSIFGFVQNPLKLKSMVNVIHQKVAETTLVNDSLKNELYRLSNKSVSNTSNTSAPIKFNQSEKILDLFSNLNESQPEKIAVEGDFERIAFNYDVTSERFWSDLDSSKFESAAEEMDRKEREASTLGAPLKIDYRESFSKEFDGKDDSIYALNKSNKF